MTSINSKLGLRPAGQRSMMKDVSKLPLAERNRITSAKCPHCQQTGARVSRTEPGKLYCTWCNKTFAVPESDV